MPARKATPTSNTHRVWFYLSMLFLLLLGFLNILTYTWKAPAVIALDTAGNDLTFWEKIQKQNPTYRDAYLVLAKLKEKEGDVLSAQSYERSARDIDPFAQPFIQ